MKRIKQVFALAQEVRHQFEENGVFDYEKNREMEDIAYEDDICVYFDEDGIPEQVEDEKV